MPFIPNLCLIKIFFLNSIHFCNKNNTFYHSNNLWHQRLTFSYPSNNPNIFFFFFKQSNQVNISIIISLTFKAYAFVIQGLNFKFEIYKLKKFPLLEKPYHNLSNQTSPSILSLTFPLLVNGGKMSFILFLSHCPHPIPLYFHVIFFRLFFFLVSIFSSNISSIFIFFIEIIYITPQDINLCKVGFHILET